MKTIEEAAKKSVAEILTVKEDESAWIKTTDLHDYLTDQFNAGVEFATRWIPVEEELPPKEKDTDESEIVLIKETQDFGNFFLGWYDYHQKAWFMVYRLHRVKPTHWRSVSFL